MGYEIFHNVAVRRANNVASTSPRIRITKRGFWALNKSAVSLFKKQQVEFVNLLWDEKSRRIRFRRVDEVGAVHSYRIKYNITCTISGFYAKAFLDHMRFDLKSACFLTLRSPANDDIVEAEVPEEYLGPVIGKLKEDSIHV